MIATPAPKEVARLEETSNLPMYHMLVTDDLRRQFPTVDFDELVPWLTKLKAEIAALLPEGWDDNYPSDVPDPMGKVSLHKSVTRRFFNGMHTATLNPSVERWTAYHVGLQQTQEADVLNAMPPAVGGETWCDAALRTGFDFEMNVGLSAVSPTDDSRVAALAVTEAKHRRELKALLAK